MNYCYDCKYRMENPHGGEPYCIFQVKVQGKARKAVHGPQYEPDLDDLYFRCYTQRMGPEGESCGLNGLWFQPKEVV